MFIFKGVIYIKVDFKTLYCGCNVRFVNLKQCFWLFTVILDLLPFSELPNHATKILNLCIIYHIHQCMVINTAWLWTLLFAIFPCIMKSTQLLILIMKSLCNPVHGNVNVLNFLVCEDAKPFWCCEPLLLHECHSSHWQKIHHQMFSKDSSVSVNLHSFFLPHIKWDMS